jgi:hypothetical protein
MHCGCPIPGDTIGQKMSRLTKSVFSGRSAHEHSDADSPLAPPAREDALAGSHPSDHNAVYSLTNKEKSELARAMRRAKVQRRQLREQKDSGGRKDLDGKTRGVLHEPAFLVPVPLWYGYASCAGWSAGVINGAPGAAWVSVA